MKRILVPTDFSECAAGALRYAALLARKAAAEIVLVHACDLLDPQFQSRKGLIEEFNRAEAGNLRRRLEAIRLQTEEADRVPVTTRLYEGEPVASVLQAIRDTDPQLVVMGTQGASKTVNVIFGSQTAALIGKSPIPVISVPHTGSPAEPRTIVFATNNPSEAGQAGIAFEIAFLFDARMKVVMFEPNLEEAAALILSNRSVETIKGTLQRHHANLLIDSEVFGGSDFRSALQEYLENQPADLLVMLTHQASGLFAKNMTRKMSYYASIPLLAVPLKKNG